MRVFSDVEAVNCGIRHLRLADSRLTPLIEAFGAPERLLAKNTSCFKSLAKSIVYQQLAGSAAAAIFARLLTACEVPDESQLTPAAVLAVPLPSMRACGLSERKASYLQDLAAHFQDGRLSDQLLTGASDAELLERLTAVRGIGPWTVDMFAMFHRGSPDILPVGDLGVRKGLAHLCGLKHLPNPEEMQQLTEAWRPYRSVGCYYMWRTPLPPKAARQSKTKAERASKKLKGGAVKQLAQDPPVPPLPVANAVPSCCDVGTDVESLPAAARAPAAAAKVDVLNIRKVVEGDRETPLKRQPHAPPPDLRAPSTADSMQSVEGVMTRRKLLWAQRATGPVAASRVTGTLPTGRAAKPGVKARIVDL